MSSRAQLCASSVHCMMTWKLGFAAAAMLTTWLVMVVD